MSTSSPSAKGEKSKISVKNAAKSSESGAVEAKKSPTKSPKNDVNPQAAKAGAHEERVDGSTRQAKKPKGKTGDVAGVQAEGATGKPIVDGLEKKGKPKFKKPKGSGSSNSKSSSKSNRPRLHPTMLTELATKIFNPALFPRQPVRPPPMYPPPGLCYSRLPPPCAEVDDAPTWRRRRWRVWDEVYSPLRRVVLNPTLRGQLRRHQTFTIPPSQADDMAYPIKGIHRRIFPRGREVGLTIETYDDRPHLSELLQWRAARPRAWSGHASIPSSPLTSGSGIPPASGPLETGIQPPLTPVGSPISPLAPSKVSPARQADPSPSRPVTSRLLAQIKQTCMPTGFQQNLTPPKLNSAQRKAKREQLRTHKWILDIENERRWRTGMRRLMDEVYDFQEASMLEPDKWEFGKGVFLPDYDYEEVQAMAEKFKSIRQTPEKEYELYPDLGPVPGRAEAQRKIDEDEAERRKRRDAKKVRRSGSDSATPSPPSTPAAPVKLVTESTAGSPSKAPLAAMLSEKAERRPVVRGETAMGELQASEGIVPPVMKSTAEQESVQPAALPAVRSSKKARSKKPKTSSAPVNADSPTPVQSPTPPQSRDTNKEKRAKQPPSAEPASASATPRRTASTGQTPKASRGSAEQIQRPVKPASERTAPGPAPSQKAPDSPPARSLNGSPRPDKPATSKQMGKMIGAPDVGSALQRLMALLQAVEAAADSMPGAAAAARFLKEQMETSPSIASGFEAEFGTANGGGGGGEKAEMIRVAHIMGALDRMDAMLGKRDEQESTLEPEAGDGGLDVVEVDDAASDIDASSISDDEVFEEVHDYDDNDDDSKPSTRAGSAVPTYRWGSANMDDDTRAPGFGTSTLRASPPDSAPIRPGFPGPVRRQTTA